MISVDEGEGRERSEMEESTAGLLHGIRVLDLSGDEGVYGARLLADLGADVVRIVLGPQAPGGPGPMVGGSSEPVSAFALFCNLNKRTLRADPGSSAVIDSLQVLVEAADLVIADALPEGITVPESVALVTSSTFGQMYDGTTRTGSDLVGLAAGGLLSLGGYPDTSPVAVYGNQAYLCGGIITGVAALLALLERDNTVDPVRVDVSVQTTLVGAMEDATAEFDLRGTVRRRAGDLPREAGTGIFRTVDGYVAMVAGKLGTAQAWLNLVTWMVEEGVVGAEELAGAEWTTIEKRRQPESLEFFMTVFESFTTTKSSEWLYREGQERSIAVAPVNTLREVLSDPQLAYRDFFRHVETDLGTLTVPGRPYRLVDLANRDEWAVAREVDLETIFSQWTTVDAETGVA
jgi:crotonobetainyl-CoA:carnitine CoA-transferase CaiB-like acyl-CoA transferase